MVRQAAISGAFALATNLIFPQGLFWIGKSPRNQSYAEFLVATMIYVSFFMALTMLLGYCSALTQYHHTSRPNALRSFWFWAALVIKKSYPHYIVSLACVTSVAYAGTFVRESLRSLQLHFYVAGFLTNYYTAALNVTSHRIFQCETVEGIAIGYVNASPLWKRLAVAYHKDIMFVLVVYLASAYIHISSRLQLTSQEGLFLFSFVSLIVRVVTVKATRSVVLRLRKVHIRVVYIVTVVPTMLINTQVRVALLRVQSNVSLTGVIILALVEPTMRVLKVWALRREVQHKTTPSTISQVVSEPRLRNDAVADGQLASVVPLSSSAIQPQTKSVSETSRWTKRLLQFTAAEIHADMCSEYIAIACSMSIYYCLEGNPKFQWNVQQGSNKGQTTASRVELVLIQLVVEIAVDFLCSVVELVNGIPLKPAAGMTGFLSALFTGCAITNIVLCCSFYLRQSETSGWT